MKRNLKIITLFAIFLQFICFYTKVDARGMEFKAKNAGDGGIIFETYIGAFSGTIASYKDGINVKDEKNFSKSYNRHNFYYLEDKSYYIGNKVGETRKFISPWGDNVLNDYNDNTVRSWSFLIHNKEFTKYTSGNMYTYSTKSYDSNIPSTNANKIDITGENSNVNSIEFKRLSEGYQLIKPNNFSPPVSVDSDKFPKSYIDEILKDKDKYITQDSNGTSYCYISEPLTFNYNEATKEKTWYSKRDVKYKDKNSNEIKTINNANVGLKTAYDIHYKDQKDFKGSYLKVFEGLKGYNGVNSTPLNSFINYYDNKLFLPDNIIGQKDKVYVRHILSDKKGNKKYLEGNAAEILSENGKETTLNNTPGKLTDSQKNKGFSEYYELNSNQSLKVSRSLTLVENGKYYDIDSVSSSTATDFNKALNQGARKYNDRDTVTVYAGNNGQVTVITFEYIEKDITDNPDDPEPYGNVKTLRSGVTNKNCNYSYTPTSSLDKIEYGSVNVNPYLETKKISSIKKLKYRYEVVDNKVGYKLSEFIINKLESGKIDNSDTSDTGIGEVFSNQNSKKALLKGNGRNLNFKGISKNDILSILKLEEEPIADNVVRNLPKHKDLQSNLKDNNNRTVEKDWPDNNFEVNENVYNGIRKPKLTATYCEYDVIHGQGSTTRTQTFETKNDVYIVAYNPIKIGKVDVNSENIVDHTTKNGESTGVIQKNANFTLTIDSLGTTGFYGNDNYNNMLKYYYIKFDFNVIINEVTKGERIEESEKIQKIQYFSPTGKKEEYASNAEIPKGTIIQIPYKYNSNNKIFIKAKAGSNVNSKEYIAQGTNQITLIGSSTNEPILNDNSLRDNIFSGSSNFYGEDSNLMFKINETSYYNLGTSICDDKKNNDEEFYKSYEAQPGVYNDNNNKKYSMYYDAYYFAKSNTEIKTVGRIYDFEITDCSDIDYKSVFRSTKNGNVNQHTGNIYFSGMKELQIFTNTNINDDVNYLKLRDDNILNISGTSAKKILPLGPYKNTNTSYVKAPKMGYRISFDLKTSGYYNYKKETAADSKRVITITPTYYYISKDGKTYESEIDLYYKNSDGKYVNFVGSNYTIYFKPKDGYRTYSNSQVTPDLSVMSDQLEALDISNEKGFDLNYKMMATNNNNFIQSWYGEFKLPNSTIAIIKGNDISHPLTDGYIGVRFNIVCTDKDKDKTVQEISYNTNNKNASPNTNTSQWDYEGYLGFSNPGSAAGDIALQLEKGTWTVNDNNSGPKAKYTDIKGTVVLFDLDNRAANDFD